MGNFTAHSLYKAMETDLKRSITTSSTFSWIWKLPIQPKIKSFIWLLYHDRLPTKDYLRKINLTNGTSCAYCKQEEENIKHIFLTCVNTRSYWQELGLTNLITSLAAIPSTKTWLRLLINSKGITLPFNINP